MDPVLCVLRRGRRSAGAQRGVRGGRRPRTVLARGRLEVRPLAAARDPADVQRHPLPPVGGHGVVPGEAAVETLFTTLVGEAMV